MSHETVAGAGTLSATYPAHKSLCSNQCPNSSFGFVHYRNTNTYKQHKLCPNKTNNYYMFHKLLSKTAYVMQLILNQMYAICDD